MNETPRIFVGTMYSQEGDFQISLERIQKQEGVIVTHFIVAGLSEKDAHNALWKAWNDNKSSHDLFVKVDADTVLASTKTLSEMVQLFKDEPRLTSVQAPLHDYMTDEFINGLNAFSPKVVFNDTRDELFCDRVDTGHDIRMRSNEVPDHLRPAGHHCHHANERQAFHFGLHRALKGQREIMKKVHKAWKRDNDKIRAYALIGATMYDRFVSNRKFNYVDQEFNDAFNEACECYDEWIKKDEWIKEKEQGEDPLRWLQRMGVRRLFSTVKEP